MFNKNMKENEIKREYSFNETLKDILGAVNKLDYGIITIKIHDSKIVQIEITQKKRYDDTELNEKGGGI
jgi:hypothetical protein